MSTAVVSPLTGSLRLTRSIQSNGLPNGWSDEQLKKLLQFSNSLKVHSTPSFYGIISAERLRRLKTTTDKFAKLPQTYENLKLSIASDRFCMHMTHQKRLFFSFAKIISKSSSNSHYENLSLNSSFSYCHHHFHLKTARTILRPSGSIIYSATNIQINQGQPSSVCHNIFRRRRWPGTSADSAERRFFLAAAAARLVFGWRRRNSAADGFTVSHNGS